MEPQRATLNARLTALLFTAGDPIPKTFLKKFLEIDDECLHKLCEEIRQALSKYGLTLLLTNREVAIVTTEEVSDTVTTYSKHEREGELTPASLQTLTLIAYLNAPDKHEISYIRGVSSTQSIKNLLIRGLVQKIDKERYVLTADALRYLGVMSTNELPEYSRIHKELCDKSREAREEEI